MEVQPGESQLILSLLQTPFVTDLEMHRHGVRASVRNVLNSNDAKVIYNKVISGKKISHSF